MSPPSAGGSKESIASVLPGVNAQEYGPLHRGHILEIYKTYVEMSDRISARREKANAFFLTVNTALIALLAKGLFESATPATATLETLVPVSAIILCYLWSRIIRSYRDLNGAKFKVVHEIEQHLPLRPYDAEWEGVGRGHNPKLYLPFTHVEAIVPWLFIGLHAILAVSALL